MLMMLWLVALGVASGVFGVAADAHDAGLVPLVSVESRPMHMMLGVLCWE